MLARLTGWSGANEGLGAWGLEGLKNAAPEWIAKLFALLRPRAKKLTDYAEQLTPFFVDPVDYDADGVKKHLGTPEMAGHLSALRDAYAAAAPFDEATLEQALRSLADARGIKAGALIHGTRLAMTGRMVSPGLFEMLVLLGRDRVMARLDALIKTL